MKHRASSTHRMDAPDRHKGQPDKQTNKRTYISFNSLSVRLFVSSMEFDTKHKDLIE